jgi:hypothetical protein
MSIHSNIAYTKERYGAVFFLNITNIANQRVTSIIGRMNGANISAWFHTQIADAIVMAIRIMVLFTVHESVITSLSSSLFLICEYAFVSMSGLAIFFC